MESYDDLNLTPQDISVIAHAIKITNEKVLEEGMRFDWFVADQCLYGYYIWEVYNSPIRTKLYDVLSGSSHIAMLRSNADGTNWPAIRDQLMIDLNITQDQVDAS